MMIPNARSLKRSEIRDQGLIIIGEFGFGGVGDAGLIVAPAGPVAEKVRKVYEAEDNGESITDQLDMLTHAGGEFIRESE
jgi:hypothetical protein